MASPKVLGIETSCDETAASIVTVDDNNKPQILSNVVFSQIDIHKEFGGVMPEIAARSHVDKIDAVINQSLADANLDINEIDIISATSGPGLLGGLVVGMVTAQTIARALQKPFYQINHLEGHALTPRLTDNISFPYLMLLVSGGHTQILLIKSVGEYQRLATTFDDALGEAFDKCAKLMGLGYPGGAKIEQFAKNGNVERFPLPHPRIDNYPMHFSFAGLKTALKSIATAHQPLDNQTIADLAASFQETTFAIVNDRLTKAIKTARAILNFDDETPLNLAIAGGVAANNKLRESLNDFSQKNNAPLILPEPKLCTDNGAMIAWAALERFNIGIKPDSGLLSPKPRWPLDKNASKLPFAGKKA